MRLKREQKEKLLTLIAAGLTSDEINSIAAKFESPFSVSRQQVDWYRKTRKVDINILKKTGEQEALTEGLALKDERVKVLKALAERMIKDLLHKDPKKEKIWLNQLKGLGTGVNFRTYRYKEFNQAEFQQLRGVLDDIAKEVGERQTHNVLSTDKDNPLIIGMLDAESIRERIGKRFEQLSNNSDKPADTPTAQ